MWYYYPLIIDQDFVSDFIPVAYLIYMQELAYYIQISHIFLLGFFFFHGHVKDMSIKKQICTFNVITMNNLIAAIYWLHSIFQ